MTSNAIVDNVTAGLQMSEIWEQQGFDAMKDAKTALFEMIELGHDDQIARNARLFKAATALHQTSYEVAELVRASKKSGNSFEQTVAIGLKLSEAVSARLNADDAFGRAAHYNG